VHLGAPRPNPFHAATRFQVSSPAGVPLRVSVYDLSGRRIRDLEPSGGDGTAATVTWDGRDTDGRRVASGMYFVRARAGEWTAGRRVVVTH
ncbi:MAG: T9SS type A sorting domain-containing protein, partial [Gemmatimonadetes bacterium]|nr:T9SS type A sorting domain-containing protein [Gemmatimonadota bacterium]